MKKLTLTVMVIMLAAAFCCVMDAADAKGQIEHEGDNFIKVSGTSDFDIVYVLDDGDEGKDIEYSAKVINKAGETQSSAVSPSTGTLDSGVAKTLTVTAPKEAGTYQLIVLFTVSGGDADDKTEEETYSFKVVNPIKLTVNLEAKDVTLDLKSFGVYFYIDDQKMEDSYSTITLASDGTGAVSYEWVADPAANSTHTFYVKAVGGESLIKGLDEVHTFYANDSDYSLITAFAVIILIVLIVMFVWVYRKPVKNFGKPKSRR